ncbi:hypothetical protein KAX06_07785 [candidate division WOR-3 bacterium]|nr:hypothetical protein [candidate division WOR-3 bacterium]
MKKYVLLFVLLASVAWGVEVTGIGGGNYQSWDDGNGNIGSGVGLHAGLLGGIGITPSCLPVYIGAETGFLIQSAKYTWETGFGGVDLILKYNNVVIPVLLKATLKPSGGFHIGAGLGPSFSIHTSGATGIGNDNWNSMVDIPEDDLRTDVGFQVKGDLGIKLIPTLWLKPSVTVQLTGNPYSPITQERQGSETTLYFSVGLAIKP